MFSNPMIYFLDNTYSYVDFVFLKLPSTIQYISLVNKNSDNARVIYWCRLLFDMMYTQYNLFDFINQILYTRFNLYLNIDPVIWYVVDYMATIDWNGWLNSGTYAHMYVREMWESNIATISYSFLEPWNDLVPLV